MSLLIGTLSASAADDLTGYKYEHQMRELIELEIMAGYPDGTYKPENIVTRAEFAKFVVASFELQSEEVVPSVQTQAVSQLAFTDVPVEKWYAAWVADAVNAGVVSGYPDGTFKPDQQISREQMAAMVARAMHAKGVISEGFEIPELTFKDSDKIHPSYREDVKFVAFHGVINGDGLGFFNPKDSSTRWMVALVMLNGREIIFPAEPKAFQVAAIRDGQPEVVRQFDTFDRAKTYAQAGTSLIVQRDGIIVWIKNGIAVSNKFVNLFPGTDLVWKTGTQRERQFRPYVTQHTELKYHDATETYVKVELADKVSYADAGSINLIPKEMITEQAYFARSGDHMLHYIYNYGLGRYEIAGQLGVAPAAFVTGERYYSWDGFTFTDVNGKFVTEAHQYFNKLNLRSTTNYTAEELDKYLLDKFPHYNKTVAGKLWTTSPLVGIGTALKEIEAEYNLNALYLMGHAIHESGWGTSLIAQDKKNLFGYGAVDSDPYRGAYTYATFKESIADAADRVTKNYQTVNGSFFNGSFLGNKGLGMNVRYASDPYWGEKIAGHMYRTDLHLGKKDIFKEQLYMTNAGSPVNFRRDATVNFAALYTLPENGMTVNVKETITIPNALSWYRVVPEERAFQNAYVRSDLLKAMPLAR
ncbi:S-layer homology domain-containing protein [Chryseomicrobium sp. FSL W7-1435]|uniref:S-layer homology domain-containing protein n=1 Tax=Chryseomicrobium sp. FSL W7-1435 TaxID=2921704 RepID=UPI00315A5239